MHSEFDLVHKVHNLNVNCTFSTRREMAAPLSYFLKNDLVTKSLLAPGNGCMQKHYENINLLHPMEMLLHTKML